ncbi:MAG: hypothetical protein IKP22_06290 [Clostridia bacterium]|nr:hypothetical protein [Clostridia bacterium]
MRRCAVFPLSVLILFAMIFSPGPGCVADDELTLTENIFGARETLSCWVDVPGRGEVRYYAQNDGLWIDLIYETPSSTKKRPFGDGGCNPTALAMAVRMLVDEKDLPAIASDAARPYSLCNCSLNKNACGYGHARYYLTSPRDYDRFLPLVFADYACGNNIRGVRSRSEAKGTVGGYMKYVCDAYGLDLATVSDQKTGLNAVTSGDKAVIAYCASGGAFTTVGHYVLIAWADDTNVYFLDPLCREKYRTNNSSHVHIIQPGLVYMSRSELKYAGISGYIIIEKNNAAP